MKHHVRPCAVRPLMAYSAGGLPDICDTCTTPSACDHVHVLGEATARFAQPTEEPATMYDPILPGVDRTAGFNNPKEATGAAKEPLDYLEPLVNAPVARVMKHGGDKYGVRNYTITPCKIRTYIGAVRRHLDAIAMGEDIDPDSGESHWAHIIAGSSCYLACELSGLAVDNRAATTTPRSDAVHIDGNQDAKAGRWYVPCGVECLSRAICEKGGCVCAAPKLPKLDPGYGGF